MWVLTSARLAKFWAQHASAKGPLKAWRKAVSDARWATTNDVKKEFSTASFVGNNRIVFNIGGNNYRLVVSMDFKKGRVFIRFIGTHADYDKINAKEV